MVGPTGVYNVAAGHMGVSSVGVIPNDDSFFAVGTFLVARTAAALGGVISVSVATRSVAGVAASEIGVTSVVACTMGVIESTADPVGIVKAAAGIFDDAGFEADLDGVVSVAAATGVVVGVPVYTGGVAGVTAWHLGLGTADIGVGAISGSWATSVRDGAGGAVCSSRSGSDTSLAATAPLRRCGLGYLFRTSWRWRFGVGWDSS